LIFEFGLLNSSARDTNATGANTGPVLLGTFIPQTGQYGDHCRDD
jgi:hypothetical protein